MLESKTMMKNKNKLCHCKSGKRYKNCCIGKKPRSAVATMDFGKQITGGSFKANSKTGSIEIYNDGKPIVPVEAILEMEYERENSSKGPKKLSRTQISGSEMLMHPLAPSMALNQYDHIVAIDTNTKQLSDEFISVSGVVIGRQGEHQDPLKFRYYKPTYCLEFRNIKSKHENVAWKKLIEMIQAEPSYNSSKKIGVIVDSDLGNIARFNRQNKPLLDDFYLPDNFSLIYASSDSGKENVQNIMISLGKSVV